MKIFVTLLIFALATSTSLAIRCHIDGDCSTGSLLTITTAANYSECLHDCRDVPGCKTFTYCESRGCNLFSSCPSISHSGNGQCETGDVICPDQLICKAEGSCIGEVEFSTADDYTECLANCKVNPTCSWFTFYPSSKQCTMTLECEYNPSICPDCIIGENLCPYDPNDKRILMFFGGEYDENQVKAVDLTGEGRECEPIVDLPTELDYGSVATFVNDEAIVCGGSNLDDGTSHCYALFREVNGSIFWTPREDMLTNRSHASAAMFDDDTWFITGGLNEYINSYIEITEMRVGGNGSQPRAEMPKSNGKHALVALNENEAVSVGGVTTSSYVRHYNRNLDRWDSFTFLPLPKALDSYVRAGLATNSQGQRTLIALDRTNSFKLDLDDPFGVWLPAAYVDISYMGPTVPFKNSFLLMDSGEINYYNPDTELFEPRDEYAGNTGKYAAVTLVPNYYINCN